MIFQSTPSTRRETKNSVHHATRRTFQSTPSTRRETTQKLIDKLNRMLFQSTPSTRRETGGKVPKLRRFHISIHSLHTEGDGNTHLRNILPVHFNPLPPHGGRLDNVSTLHLFSHFNPLPPHGGRLAAIDFPGDGVNISIHSLHTEGDLGEREYKTELNISIHSLHTEGD